MVNITLLITTYATTMATRCGPKAHFIFSQQKPPSPWQKHPAPPPSLKGDARTRPPPTADEAERTQDAAHANSQKTKLLSVTQECVGRVALGIVTKAGPKTGTPTCSAHGPPPCGQGPTGLERNSTPVGIQPPPCCRGAGHPRGNAGRK